jgi:hypothetical protein
MATSMRPTCGQTRRPSGGAGRRARAGDRGVGAVWAPACVVWARPPSRLVVPAGQRERLERIVRYALRPPVAQERLELAPDGQVRLELRHSWRDGTTALVFDPVEFLGRLAVLVPRPRINLCCIRA